MGDNMDGRIEWKGPNPIRAASPALRNVKNALLAGETLEAERATLTVRAMNGSELHANTDQKGPILHPNVISPGNHESRRITSDGNRSMLSRRLDGLPLIPTYRKLRLVSNGNVRNPIGFTPIPTQEQAQGLGWFVGVHL